MWAILGGSGFDKFQDVTVVESLIVETPFGKPSGPIVKALINDTPVLFLSRHGLNHEFSPSTINYRANIYALKAHGASKVIAISAVGSLRRELERGDCVIPTQYINWTKLARGHTFCSDGVVGHVALAHPVNLELVKQVQKLIPNDIPTHFHKTYICIEGPAFSTKAESTMYRGLGADIIGMTNFPEYALAKEAGMYYLPLSFVTDYDAWNDEVDHVTIDQIVEIMRQNNKKAFQLLQRIVPELNHIYPSGCPEEGIKNALLSSHEKLPEWIEVLCR